MIFSRTEMLPFVSKSKLPIDKKVIIIGCGGVGTPAALYLVSIFARVDIYDCDVVEHHNLNRQYIYTDNDVGKPKCVVLASHLLALNPLCEVGYFNMRVVHDNVSMILADVIIDATDNAETRFLLGCHCKAFNIPEVYAAASLF